MDAILGSCSCGAVRFELTPPTDFCAHCHCSSCRGASGAAFLTWTSVPRDRFELIQGRDAITWYASSKTIRWGFCSKCGSTLLYEATAAGHPESPKLDRMYVTVGSLRGPLDRKPACHVSVEEAVPWFQRADHLPGHVGKTDETLDTPTAHLILYVADQAASTRFYSAVLDTSPRLDVPGMTELALPGNALLGLMPESGVDSLFAGAVAPRAPGVSRAELYLRVRDPAAAHARALAAGAKELSPLSRRDWGHDVAYSLDPDGHVLALASC